MKAIQTGSHAVYFESSARKALDQALGSGSYSRGFILTDSNTAVHCLPVFLRNHPAAESWPRISIPAGEPFKNIDSCMQVWSALSREGADRQSLLVNLGGGVVTDLGGFVASTYQRGIRFINIPTSLLSMVDASVGGKTGVDLGVLKNQIGVINQPEMVLVCEEYLQTLDPRELRSGFAEMLKHGLIRDTAYWEALAGLDSAAQAAPYIRHSVEIKNEVVMQDPTEKNLRKILNFGHTLGHAVESYFLSHPGLEPLLHGEAIAIGMVLEAYLSVQVAGLQPADCDRIREVLRSFFPKTAIEPAHIDPICSLLVHDKKNERGRVYFTLLERIGHAVFNREVPRGMLQRAFEYYAE